MSRILRSRYKRALRPALVLVLLLVTAPAAQAVLLDGLDGSVNVSPFPDPVLDHVGLRAGLSAVYLGNGIVVTANHVGAGSVTFGGTVCDYVPNTAVRLTNVDGSLADLLMFEVYPRPDLDPLELTIVTPLFGSLLLMAGDGFDRGAALAWDPNGTYAPGLTGGYAWAPGNHLRWGFNNFEVYPAGGKIYNTQALGSFFDGGRMLPEAQAVPGDSGGAVFALSLSGDRWLLAGIMLGITQYSGQPANTSFYGQKTYFADLAYYRPQLEDAVELPEPEHVLAPAIAGIAWLARRRRRQPLQLLRLRRRATASFSVLCPPIG
jgi:hypothetical protein